MKAKVEHFIPAIILLGFAIIAIKLAVFIDRENDEYQYRARIVKEVVYSAKVVDQYRESRILGSDWTTVLKPENGKDEFSVMGKWGNKGDVVEVKEYINSDRHIQRIDVKVIERND